MARVTNPLMSLDASGSVAGSLTYAKWKGRNYVRQLVTPANPRSAGQQAARAAIGSGGRMASFIVFGSDGQAMLNEAAPSGQSGAGNWVKKMTERYVASAADYVNATYSTQKGYFDAAAATLGIYEITIPGDTPVVIPPGLILWNGYQAAHDIDGALADTTSRVATSAEITEFLGLLAA